MTAPVRVHTPRVAVTGATGEVGSRVAMLLAERGVAQRLPVSAARHAPRPANADVIEIGGYADRRGLVAAFEGIETFLLIPGRTSEPIDHYHAAIEAAAEAGVRRIVQLSRIGAAPDATFTGARTSWEIEQQVTASGLDWTIARMNLLVDLLPQLVRRTGEIVGPGAKGRVAPIGRDDVALALAALVMGSGHEQQVYELTGPESLTFREVALTMGRANRHKIQYIDTPAEQAIPGYTAQGLPADECERRMSAFAAVAEGAFERVTGDVAYLTGEAPMNLAEWLRAYPFSLVHVGALL